MTGKPLTGPVLITGGTGSLGKAILRRAHHENWDAQFTVMSRDEGKQSLLRGQYPDVRFFLGDIRDLDRMRLLFRGQRTIIHAAAYKQVPSSQVNVSQTMEVNIRGSYNVIQAALENEVKTIIGISTDKAAEPVNAYGKSKAMMEDLFQEANSLAGPQQQFVLTRYGNVIGSRGSVIPFFINQIKSGSQLTITDGDMTRFWLTLNEAVDLILETMELNVGAILVPKAQAMSMDKLATTIKAMYQSLVVITDVPVRPGEKKHECLINSAEARYTVSMKDRFHVHPPIPGKLGNVAAGFAYTSDIAPMMSSETMIRAILEWQEIDD